MKCPKCKKWVESFQETCHHCGASTKIDSLPAPDEWPKAFGASKLHATLRSEDVFAFANEEAPINYRHAESYYFRKWLPLLEGRRFLAGFNWDAWLAGINWLVYRKQYLFALLYLACFYFVLLVLSVIIALLLPRELERQLNYIISIALFLILSLPLGIFANRIYFRKALKIIEKAQTKHPQGEKRIAYIRSRGGTSKVALLIAVVLNYAVFFLMVYRIFRKLF